MNGPPTILSSLFAGRYRLDRELGRGATAIVYLARDTVAGDAVAVKFLRPELAQSMGAQGFLREIRVMRDLEHANILRLRDAGEVGDQLYLVLPYMEGGSLRQRLQRDKQLPVTDAIRIAATIADALDYAHRRNLIHRDVKPENILFTNGTACLGDFGIARALEKALEETSTSTGIVRGTPAYLSPEQASGARDYDGRSDIYSLGCVLYEMLAGMAAFVGPTPQSVIAQRLTQRPRHLRVFRPSLSRNLENVVAKALDVSPADRYQTAAEFANALRSIDTSVPSPERFWDAPRRRRIAIVVGAAAALTAAAYGLREPLASLFTRPGVVVNENRVAIAPFEVLDPADTLWRYGFVDLLSRNFDGAGPLRTVPPSVVIKNARGRIDAASAADFARRTGAGLVVFGQLMRTGRDSARLTASLIDVSNGRTFDVDIRDDVGRFDRLADSLTVALIRELGRSRTIAAVPRATLGSRSLPALKAFLQGEQYYRANDMVAASESFQRAIALDSTFAVAYRRMRGVLRAIGRGEENDSLSFWYALRAGAMNHGLSPHDSLLVLADSLAATNRLGVSFYDPATLQRVRRRFTALESAVRDYPTDPDAWYELGEARFHFGERIGVDQLSALQAFEQCLKLDPDFGPAYYHVVELATLLEGNAAGAAFARRYLATNPGDVRFSIVAAFLEHEQSPASRLHALLDSTGAGDILDALRMLRRWPDTTGLVTAQLVRVMTRSNRAPADSVRARLWLSAIALYRGQISIAHRMMSREVVSELPINYVQLALLGAVPADSASNELRGWLTGPDLRRLALSLAWWGSRADTTALKRARARFDSLTQSTTAVRDSASVRDSVYGVVGGRTARAYIALASGDTARALGHFLSVPDSLCSWFCGPDRLMTARLLMATGRPRLAAEFLDLHPPSAAATNIHEPMWMHERAQIADVLRDEPTARRLRNALAAIWARSDAPLRYDLQPEGAVH